MPSGEKRNPEPGAGNVIFDAELTPHRSLPPRGFMLLMALICVVSFLAGLAFYAIGAWPVVGFLGLDVLLIYLAFRASYRSARVVETLRLTHSALTVRHTDRWGRSQSCRLQAAWLQILMDDPPEHDSQLTLRSHGRSLTIGSFLTAEERLDLARALRRALEEARLPAPSREA